MTDAWTKYKKFVQLQNLKKHILKQKNVVVTFQIQYAFNLLVACKLSNIDEKFVLTAIDFKSGKEKKDLLTQVKNSLHKFQSREKLTGGQDGCKMKVQLEDSYVLSVEEALIVDGWKPPRGTNRGHVQKGNPIGGDGKPLKCFRYQSEYHLRDKCDQRSNLRDSYKRKEK